MFALLVGFCLFGSSDAKADMIFVGGYGFQENAFATSVGSMYSSNSSGGFIFGPLAGGVVPSSLSQAVLGSYVGDFAGSFDNMSYLQLGFAGGIRNGPGADLALFESGIVLDRFAFSLSPSTSPLSYSIYPTTFTGTYFGAEVNTNRINAALVDLSSFGLPEGARLDAVTVGLYLRTNDSRPSLTAAGAFYPDPAQPSAVPAPPGLVLALLGSPIVALLARRNPRLRSLFALVVGVCLFGSSDAKADTIFLANYQLEGRAFADGLRSSHSSDPDGGFFYGGLVGGTNPSSLNQAVLGSYFGDGAFSLDPMSYLHLGFSNGIRNGPGVDLLLVETGLVRDTFGVSLLPSTLASDYRLYSTTFYGDYFGAHGDANRLNIAEIDLSTLGVPLGGRLDSITIGTFPITDSRFGPGTASITAAGALYPDPVATSAVPAPPGPLLLLSGAPFVVLLAWRNRRVRCLPMLVGVLVISCCWCNSAHAEFITIANIQFRENAFADSVQSTYTTDSGFVFGPLIGGVSPATLSGAVIGPYVGDYAGSIDPFSFIQLGFTDNVIRNGPGADLILFDVGAVQDRFAVSLRPSLHAADFRLYQSTFTGSHFGASVPFNQINVARIDLSDFGLVEGQSISSITVGLYPVTIPPNGIESSVGLTAAGAVYPDPVQPNAVPAPPGMVLALMGVPFALIMWRNRRLRSPVALVFGVCLYGSSDAKADFITIGNIQFRDNAFADTLQSSYAGHSQFFFGPAVGGISPGSLGQAVIGPYVGDFSLSPSSFSYLQLGFTDNVLRNAPGADLVLFDLGAAQDRFAVSLLPSLSTGSFIEYQSNFTGTYFGSGNLDANRINAAFINLSDFGVAEGADLRSITIGLYPTTSYLGQPNRATFTAAGTLYPDPIQPSVVPAPPGIVLALMSVPFIGLAAWRKRREQAAAPATA